MRSSLELNPIANIRMALDPVYLLNFIQEPKYARESTVLKTPLPFLAVNIHKRLLHPFPIITLKLYARDKSSRVVDITDHTLSLFFLRASLVDEMGDENSPIVVGTKVMAGTLYSLPKGVGQSEEGIVVFMFTDLGFLKKGSYRMCFELYKFEAFKTGSKAGPLLAKIKDVRSGEIKVYGPREYYRKLVQDKIQNDMQDELKKMNNDQARLKVIRYLRSINTIKDYERSQGYYQEKTRRHDTEKKRRVGKKNLAIFEDANKKAKTNAGDYDFPAHHPALILTSLANPKLNADVPNSVQLPSVKDVQLLPIDDCDVKLPPLSRTAILEDHKVRDLTFESSLQNKYNLLQ